MVSSLAEKKRRGGEAPKRRGGKETLPDVLTMGQAAAALGVSRQAIWHAVNRGRLKALRFQHVVLIPRGALDEYQRTKSKGGRPKKKPESARGNKGS
jgi:excisionase family DNA binding protein